MKGVKDPLTDWGRQIMSSLLAGLGLVYGAIWLSGRGDGFTLAFGLACLGVAAALALWAHLSPAS